jgi:hypothetical protein
MRASIFLLLVAMGMTGCRIRNEPPGLAVLSIQPESPLTGDDLEVLITSPAPDADGDTVSYRYTWFQDGVLRTDLEGTTVPAAETTKDETWRVVVVANDSITDGDPVQAQVDVLNSPPTASLQVEPAAPGSHEDITATATGQDDDGDLVSFDYLWSLEADGSTHSGDTLPSELTTAGDTWTISVTPSDDEGEGEPASMTVRVDNSLPEIESVLLWPDPAYETDTLHVQVMASDVDGDELTLIYAWTVDGSVVLEGEQDSLTGDHFDKHQQVQVSVTANDGFGDSEPMNSDSLTISNSPPSASGASLDPAELYEASVGSCVGSGWQDPDGDAETYATSWWVDGVLVSSASTLDGTSFDRGQAVACGVTPDDGDDQGEILVSEPVEVLNTPPTITSASLSSTSPQVGDTLTATISGASDDDGDTVTTSYTWTVDGALAGTSDSFLISGASSGQQIQVQVTPHDGFEYGSPVSSDVAVLVNSPPEVQVITLTPDPCTTDDTLSATVLASDPDGDAVSNSYAWTVDGASIPPTTSSLNGASWFDKHQVVQLTVTPSDGSDSGSAVSSDAITVANTPPTAPGVFLNPTVPYPGGDDILCEISPGSSDDDGDTVSYGFAWTVDGVAFSGATTTTHSGDTVPAASTALDQRWACTVTPNDGEDDGDVSSATTVVAYGCDDPDTWYADGDSDGYGDASAPYIACDQPSGHVSDYSDCDDGDATIYPGAPEVDAGVDNNCDGVVGGMPVAVAQYEGASSTLLSCDALQLDGSGSSDPDGDALGFEWSLLSAPSGSARATEDIYEPDDEMPVFYPDLPGDYEFELMVDDGMDSSEAASLSLTIADRGSDQPPLADAGGDHILADTVTCSLSGYSYVCSDCGGSSIVLDGSGSYDPDDELITYSWSITSGSSWASLSDGLSESQILSLDGCSTTFGSTSSCTVEIQLVVTDCPGRTSTDTMVLDWTCEGI